jgi:plasmid stabilization system protein ParE
VIRVELAAAARAQAERIDAWWRENRTASPALFRDELADVLARLGVTPLLGTPYEWDGPFAVRRVLMPHARYCLYYSFDSALGVVRVRAIWHTSRGRDPTIR